MTTTEIDWTAYSEHYDLLCETNDVYTDMVDTFLSYCEEVQIAPDAKIVDLGAGTGNFLLKIGARLPESALFHVDSNREMNALASNKYENTLMRQPTLIEEPVQSVDFPPDSIDLIICVNALYAMNPQSLILQKIYTWLRPGGVFYVVDLGRTMDSTDWGLHFLKTAAKQRTLLKYMRDTLKAREVIKQNRLSTIAQETGRYWTHETEEFGEALKSAGFSIEILEPCYRGYADLAVCRK